MLDVERFSVYHVYTTEKFHRKFDLPNFMVVFGVCTVSVDSWHTYIFDIYMNPVVRYGYGSNYKLVSSVALRIRIVRKQVKWVLFSKYTK